MPAIDEAMLEEIYQRALRIEKIRALREEKHSDIANIIKRLRLALSEEDREIEALRERRHAELVQAATAIFDWVRDFTNIPKGRRVLSILGELTIFRGRYHNYRPIDREGFEALLTFDSNGALHYHEFCQLYPGVLQTKLSSHQFSSPEHMVSQLHSDYIISALDSIARGEVWSQVKDDVTWCGVRWRG